MIQKKGKPSTMKGALIPFSFIPTDVQMNRIIAKQGLIPGEYALLISTTTADDNITVRTFGID